jgi:hypothetical protein
MEAMRSAVRGSPSGVMGAPVVNMHFSFPNYVGSRQELEHAIRKTVKRFGGSTQRAFGR